MALAACGSVACLSYPSCSPRTWSSSLPCSARFKATSNCSGQLVPLRCTALDCGYKPRQPLCLTFRPIQSPCRPARSQLCASSSAAGANADGSFQAEQRTDPVLADTAQTTSQPQQQSQPGALHQQLARVHLESALRRDDFRRSMAALSRHLQGQARTSTPRNVLLTWLALPFLLIGIALRTPIQLLAGFHRERLIRLRLLRWVAKRSAVLKLSKATQADPANAEKYVTLLLPNLYSVSPCHRDSCSILGRNPWHLHAFHCRIGQSALSSLMDCARPTSSGA